MMKKIVSAIIKHINDANKILEEDKTKKIHTRIENVDVTIAGEGMYQVIDDNKEKNRNSVKENFEIDKVYSKKKK